MHSLISTLFSSVHKPPFSLHTHHLKHHFRHLTTCSSLLNSTTDLQTLKKIHSLFIVSYSFQHVSISSKLASLYAQFGDLGSALSVFESVQEPSTVLWNSVIKAHVECNYANSALLLYNQMRKLGIEHDGFTFPILNRAISLLRDDINYEGGIHSLAIKMGFKSDMYFNNSMMDAYIKRGYFYYARAVFEEMSDRDIVSWTTMISGYASEGNIRGAFGVFRKMRFELEPSAVTVLVMMQICCSHDCAIQGKQLHGFVIKSGLLIEGSLQNSVLKMYTITGSVEDAEMFFSEIYRRDVVSWNSFIFLYVSLDDFVKVAICFNKMLDEASPSIESLTLSVSACAKSGHLLQGEVLHSFAIKSGLYDCVLKTSLLDLYAKCGEIERSIQMFGEIQFKSSITWSATISGLILGGHFERAIELFRQMQDADIKPSVEVLRSMVIVYTHMGTLKLGKTLHAYIFKTAFSNCEENNTPLQTSILTMYAKCGNISSAEKCFTRIIYKDVVTWTSMIEGYGVHGMAFEALQLFYRMVNKAIKPNVVTFLSLLSACSHSGLLHEGCRVFCTMKWAYDIEPNLDHYTCIVDLLGRCGKLKEALSFIFKSVMSLDSRIWGALLSASRVHGDKAIGEYAGKRILELEYDNVGYHTLLSNVRAIGGNWDEVEEIRKVMKGNDFVKKPGWSCVEVNGMVHGFVSGDRLHPQIYKIYEIVDNLSRRVHKI